MEINDLLVEKMVGKTKPQQTEELVKYILLSKNIVGTSNSSNNPPKMSTQEILDEYHRIRTVNPNIVNIPDGSIATNLSILAKDVNSPIYCFGKKQGYYFSKMVNSQPSNTHNQITDKPKLLEKYLYKFFVNWLQGNGYEKTKDISNMKIMGKWGNPDVVGLCINDILNHSHLEIVTIEVKLNSKNWKQDIFQAIAHTAFANRSYYAFLNSDSEKTGYDREIVSYAQKYNIGVLSISLPENTGEVDFQDSKMDLINIQEIVPAPEQYPIRTVQKKFLSNLGIRDLSDYNKF